MLNLGLNGEGQHPLRVLCLGAHSDDIEIGCAGTILKLTQQHPHMRLDWVVVGANEPDRAAEARASAEALLAPIQHRRVIVKHFRDSHFPYVGTEIKDYIETLKSLAPDLIFTHQRNDLHQDHRLISELTWQTFRDHLILEYEIPKYDGDLGAPNVFVHLDDALFQRKVAHIFDHFETQNERHWFTPETFSSLARLRAIESRSPGGYAEAFYCRKVVLQAGVQTPTSCPAQRDCVAAGTR